MVEGASTCQACGTPVVSAAAPAPPAMPKTQVSQRPATGSTAASQRNLKPLSNREEKVVTPVRVGDVLLGRYRLQEKIGEGGMGTVYVAHDDELERQVAVKVLASNLVTDDEVVERFEREARLNAKLDHPNIAPVYDVGRHEGRPFIVMKLLEGDTLAGVLRMKGGYPPGEALALLKQLAAGLDYIHGKGFIHRDIKAGNIFVSPTGHATILDFGILRPKSASGGLTRTGMVMGTPHYMAPEQALGLKDVDHRVDIYALAVVLFEVLTGTLPFEADSELRLIQMQAHQPPPDLLQRAPWIPKPVAEVMRRALAKRPDDRFNSGGELVKALEQALREAHSLPNAGPPKRIDEGTAPGWRMKAGLISAIRDAAAVEADTASPRPPDAAVSPTDGQAPTSGRAPQPPPSASAPQGGATSEPPSSPAPSGEVARTNAASSAEPGLAPAPFSPPSAGRADASPPSTGPAGLATSSPRSRRGVAAVGAVALLAAVGLVAWKLAPRPVESLAAVDAGPAVRVAEAADAAVDDEDAGAVLAVADEPDAGASAPLDAGVRVALNAGKKSGRLNVITTHGGEPWWAQVSIDGVPRGRTPLLLDLPVGKYQLRVERAGFRTQDREIKVASGKATVLRIDLVP